MSPQGERRSVEEEGRQIWHECFIHFQKGDYELVCSLRSVKLLLCLFSGGYFSVFPVKMGLMCFFRLKRMKS